MMFEGPIAIVDVGDGFVKIVTSTIVKIGDLSQGESRFYLAGMHDDIRPELQLDWVKI